MGKKTKTSFEEYTLVPNGQITETFPLPKRRDAVRAHKKFATKGGVSASKAPPDVLSASTIPEMRFSYPGLRILHLDPLVMTVDNFFTDAECEDYLKLKDCPGATHELTQSATFSSMTASARTSTTWFVRYQEAHALLAKASALLGKPVAHFEEPQLVRYKSGQAFGWHYDAVPPTQLANGGQRLATLLVYLNDVPVGGRTAFRDLQMGGTDANGSPRRVEVEPKRGRAIIFFPSDADGMPDERTLHAGEPTNDEKWIAQLWLHERVYMPNVPEGSSHEVAEAEIDAYAQGQGIVLPAGCFDR